VAVRHSSAVQQLSSATRQAESRPSWIGPISLDMKQMGERSAGNPHAAFDAEGAGNVARSKLFGLNRRASPRPYLGARGGEIPLRDSLPAFNCCHGDGLSNELSRGSRYAENWGCGGVLNRHE
jgi:hypothetical protein